MTNYKVALNGNEFDVELLDKHDNSLSFKVNGQTHHVSISHNICLQASQHEAGSSQSNSTFSPKQEIRPKEVVAKAGEVLAPMPGIVVRVATKAGQNVKAGEVLLVIEAMKMENNICATQAGVVKEILVKAGEQVKLGQQLVKCS